MKRGESQGLNLGTQSSLELCLSSFPFISAWHCFPLLLIHSLHIMDMAARNSKLLLLSSMFQLYVAVLQAPQTWWLNTTTIITILTYYLGRTLVFSLCGISLGGSKTTYGWLESWDPEHLSNTSLTCLVIVVSCWLGPQLGLTLPCGCLGFLIPWWLGSKAENAFSFIT